MARGSITKRGDSWRIAVELPADETGKRRQRFETFTGSKKDADKRLTELLSLVDQQRLGISPKVTVGEYLERWLSDYASTKSPSTLHYYTTMAHRYIAPRVGNVQLGKVTPAHIVRLLASLREAPRTDGKEGKLSPSTVAGAYRTLRAALNAAVRWQLITRNPCDGAQPPRVPRSEMKCFTVEEARRFLDAAEQEGPMWAAFFAVLLQTGCRPGELRALRWEDVSLDAGTLHIQRTAQRIPGQGIVVGTTKTGSSRRPVALGTDVVALLRRQRAEQNAHRLTMGPLWANNDLVFASEVGTYLDNKQMRVAFERICERAGVPRIRLYDLRHTSASLLLAAGVHPKVVSERLGHSSVNLTLQTYSHVLPGLQRDASETLEGLLRRAT